MKIDEAKLLDVGRRAVEAIREIGCDLNAAEQVIFLVYLSTSIAEVMSELAAEAAERN